MNPRSLLSLIPKPAICAWCLILGASALRAAETPANALLVLEKAQNTLVIVDPDSLKIVARVPVGNDPHEVAVSEDGRTAYVSNYGGGPGGYNTIAVVDLVEQKALEPIDLGALRAPHGLTFASGKLYFTAEAAKVVGRYDPATHKIDWVMGTGQNRTHMVIVAKDLKTVFTSNVSSGTISVIQQVEMQGPGPRGPGRGPSGPPLGPGRGGLPPDGRGPGGRGPGGRGAPDWNITDIPVGRGSEGFDLTPDGKELWVANAQDHTISIIDVAERKVVDTIPSTGAANRLKISPDGKFVFVSDMDGPNLLVINAATRKEYSRIFMPGPSEGLLMQPGGKRAYATLNTQDSVAVIDLSTMTVIDQVKTGKGPDGLAWAARR